MNRQMGGKASGEVSEASPLSLLVHAADAQHQRPALKGNGDRKGENDHQRARVEALQHQGILAQLRAGAAGGGAGGMGLAEAEFLQQNAALVAAQQQQQAAALALASDIRTAVAAAQLRQAAQFQNQDLLLARAAAVQQQLGALGGSAGMDQLQQELELQRLEELERRQLLAAAAGAPLGTLAARQHLEIQEAQLRQEQLDRQLNGESQSLLDRAALRNSAPAPAETTSRPPAPESSSKDSFQKTPGSVVVPCRARGMPMDHNFKTAYFVIPENVEHGEELICSYFACRNAGIKFRYCTHCKVPVAKRNFRKRHKHGKSSMNNDGDDDQSNSGEEEGNSGKPKPIETKEEEKAPEPEPSFCQEIPKKMEIPVAAVAALAAANIPKPHVNDTTKNNTIKSNDHDSSSLPQLSSQSRSRISVERERLWAALLGKRPPTKDGEAVSAWLMEVLSVSDLDTPLKENGTAGTPVTLPTLPIAKGNAVGDAAAQIVASAGKVKEDNLPSQSVLIKKKRPLALLQKEEGKKDVQKKEMGSFSDWKDRKKHKGLPKKGFSLPSE